MLQIGAVYIDEGSTVLSLDISLEARLMIERFSRISMDRQLRWFSDAPPEGRWEIPMLEKATPVWRDLKACTNLPLVYQ